jgi:serine/threonine-protein kinase
MPVDADPKNTLLVDEGRSTTAEPRSSTGSLPADLLSDIVRRLRVVALVYAGGYFVAGALPSLIIPEARVIFFSSPSHWLPVFLSIAVGLTVAAIMGHPGLSDRTKIRIGLAFEVLGSAGIASAEYQHIAAPIRYLVPGPGNFGLSWVAPWVLFFTVTVPTRPATALRMALLAVATVPLAYAIGVMRGINVPLEPSHFFLALIFPYSVVLLMAHTGSRVVYGLGREVRRAREMGSYHLVEQLGEGGMGEVWRAQHRMLARPAAIKLIRPERLGVGPEESRHVIRRFEREAQATALMRSPHTLELYDFGVAEDGSFYYVMELLDGFDLDELVEKFGPLPPERVVHLMQQVCASLGEAHAAGLIHRDIKPANIYACRHGREVDFVKVLDFGLVKHRAAAPEDDKLTAEHVAGGTPAFMSPEQAVADQDVAGRSDLYRLGCVGYWLLTGTTVFRGRTPLETMMMHVHREPEPPSQRSGRAIPAELEALVLACLAKDPDDRPQSADELASRLQGLPVALLWTPARARDWWDAERPATAPVRSR